MRKIVLSMALAFSVANSDCSFWTSNANTYIKKGDLLLEHYDRDMARFNYGLAKHSLINAIVECEEEQMDVSGINRSLQETEEKLSNLQG